MPVPFVGNRHFCFQMLRKNKWVIDSLLNVVAPVVAGIACYGFKKRIDIPAIVGNHLADGLWAYAFLSCILIIWQREVQRTWIVITFAVAIAYEWMQYLKIFSGSGDLYDVLTYFIFFIIALQLNRYFRRRFGYQNLTDAKS